jgi:hypothetical protein
MAPLNVEELNLLYIKSYNVQILNLFYRYIAFHNVEILNLLYKRITFYSVEVLNLQIYRVLKCKKYRIHCIATTKLQI